MDFTKYREGFKNIFNKQTFKSFLNKQGFYVILLVCVCAMVVTALWTSIDRNDDMRIQEETEEGVIKESGGRESSKEELAQEVDVGNEADKTDKVDIKIKDVTLDEPDKGEQNKAGQKVQDKDVHKASKSNAAAKQSIPASTATATKKSTTTQANGATQSNKSSSILMHKPVEGKVIMDFAMDHLLYSRTLKEWTTHPGIDIQSPLGSEVKAALDGVIESIEEDALMGIIITIDHGNGLKTRYANLSTKDMVTVGQKVKKGQTISGVGRTAASEILDPPHLHFEVLRDGKNVDPKKYFE